MRYKGLDLNLLHALDILLEVRNVSRAADRLHLSQSALSAALDRLRSYFGDELLLLEGRRMHPTPFAQQLVGPLRAYLEATDALLLTSRTFEPASAERSFRIVASDYVVAAILVRLAERLAVAAPGIRLDFVSPDETAMDRIQRGEMDLVISPREFLSPAQPMEELYLERFVVAGWRENPLFRQPLTTEAVLSVGHVAVAIGSHRETTFADRHMALLHGDRRIEATASSFTMVPWMLRGTNRLSFMHERLAKVMAGYLPIAYAPVPFAFPEMYEMVQHHRTKLSDTGIRWLIGEIREIAAEV